jgi:hypothetical protein
VSQHQSGVASRVSNHCVVGLACDPRSSFSLHCYVYLAADYIRRQSQAWGEASHRGPPAFVLALARCPAHAKGGQNLYGRHKLLDFLEGGLELRLGVQVHHPPPLPPPQPVRPFSSSEPALNTSKAITFRVMKGSHETLPLSSSPQARASLPLACGIGAFQMSTHPIGYKVGGFSCLEVWIGCLRTGMVLSCGSAFLGGVTDHRGCLPRVRWRWPASIQHLTEAPTLGKATRDLAPRSALLAPN